MTDTQSSDPITLNGSCHCGAVKFTAELPQGLASARRCTCSICRMRGAVAVTSTHDGFRILEGVSPFDFREVKVHDGQRHPGDDPARRTYQAGTLTFTPTEN